MRGGDEALRDPCEPPPGPPGEGSAGRSRASPCLSATLVRAPLPEPVFVRGLRRACAAQEELTDYAAMATEPFRARREPPSTLRAAPAPGPAPAALGPTLWKPGLEASHVW